MEIGNQIKTLRLRRGITQEAMAQHFGITPQAVSKWERGVATPDIAMLPDLSAYFGVTIDELFAVSDETRMERIQNMLWDVRYLPQTEIDSAREFLLEKARREPDKIDGYAMLADLENHIAAEHHSLAANYAREVLRIDPGAKAGYSALTEAMGGVCGDWNTMNHHELIEYLKTLAAEHPTVRAVYRWLLEQLIDTFRFQEASAYCDKMEMLGDISQVHFYRCLIAEGLGDHERADRELRVLEEHFGDEWVTWMSLGDYYARAGKYDLAEQAYRKYLQLQSPPRYTDGLTAIAQMREAMGDYAGAIQAVREEIAVLASDWNTTAGESVDQFQRKIFRLEQKMAE